MVFYCYEVGKVMWCFKMLKLYLLGTGLQIPPAAQQALQMSGSMVAMAAATGQFLVFCVKYMCLHLSIYFFTFNKISGVCI